MRRKTDYMFVLGGSPVRLLDVLLATVAMAVALGAAAGFFAAWLGGLTGWLVVLLAALAAAKSLSAVCSTVREHDERGGCRFPPISGRAPSSILMAGFVALGAALPGWGLIPLAGAAVFAVLWARRRTRATIRETWEQAGRALWIYLCYPDKRYAIIGGWFGIWTPESSMSARQWRLVWFIAPAAVVLGMRGAAALSLAPDPLPGSTGLGCIHALVCICCSPVIVRAILAPATSQLEHDRESAFDRGTTAWEACEALVRNSTYEEGECRLADHVFVGYLEPPHTAFWHPYATIPANMLPTSRPMVLHRQVVDGHGQIIGKTQYGKTSIAMFALFLQLTRGPRVAVVDGDGNPVLGLYGDPQSEEGPNAPTLIIDMKGDLSYFNAVREECARRGQPFHAFTLEQGLNSAYFSAIEEFDIDGRPSVELTELTANALSLYWGAVYGRAYYSAQHRDLLLDAFRSNPRPRTWAELQRRLLASLDRDKHRDVFELLSKVRVLAEYPQLGMPPPGADVIRMRQVLEEGHCVYFWLPASVAAMSVRDVGKLALYAFLTEARTLANAGRPRRSYIFIDEIQCLTGDNLAIVFQQCAGTKVTVVMANQSPRDLDTDTSNALSQVVRDNVSWRNVFSLNDVQEMDKWIRESGESLHYLASYGDSVSSSDKGSSVTSSINWHPVVHRRLTEDLIRQVNYTRGASLLQVDRDGPSGVPLYGVAHRIWSPWPLAKAEYDRLASSPWPRAPRPAPAAPTATVNTRSHERVGDDALAEFSALDDLFKSLRSQREPPGRPVPT